MNVTKELRRLVRDALILQGGTGGLRKCKYCWRTSFAGQPEHYRVGVKTKDEHLLAMRSEQFRDRVPDEAHEHCAVTVMREAIKELSKRRR